VRQKQIALRGDNAAFYEYEGYESILSGPAETGKTFAGLLKLHRLLDTYPGAQIALLRKVERSLKGTALITYRRDILQIESFKQPHPGGVRVYGGESPQWFDYPNGSRLWVGGLDKPGKTLSGERDVIYVVQAEELTASDWEYLSRMTTGRGSVMPFTQLCGDCNPGNQSHWILSRANQGILKLFATTHKDNPTLWDGSDWTAQGKRTLEILSNMSGSRYKRLYQGLWSAPEGMIYDVYDDTVHKIVGFKPPLNWPRVVGIDPFGDVIAALWLAYDPGNSAWHVYREYLGVFGATTQGHADPIKALTGAETVFYWCGGGPSERQARADFRGYGIPLLKPATGEVWSQIDRVYTMLKRNQLFIHDTCPQLLSEIGEYHRHVKNGEVQNATIADKEAYHCLDALRYAVTGPENSGRKQIWRPRL